ncbi:MAG: hypothetical protein IJ997_00055 [Mycoplasmataceae bacterium]|nr:hypothetical protein [Mycoplasmataceae bacterium]
MKIQKNKLIALILMLIPVISIIGVIIYVIDMLKGNYSMLEIILVILTIPFGVLAAIFLWLNALGVLKL